MTEVRGRESGKDGMWCEREAGRESASRGSCKNKRKQSSRGGKSVTEGPRKLSEWDRKEAE